MRTSQNRRFKAICCNQRIRADIKRFDLYIYLILGNNRANAHKNVYHLLSVKEVSHSSRKNAIVSEKDNRIFVG